MMTLTKDEARHVHRIIQMLLESRYLSLKNKKKLTPSLIATRISLTRRICSWPWWRTIDCTVIRELGLRRAIKAWATVQKYWGSRFLKNWTTRRQGILRYDRLAECRMSEPPVIKAELRDSITTITMWLQLMSSTQNYPATYTCSILHKRITE